MPDQDSDGHPVYVDRANFLSAEPATSQEVDGEQHVVVSFEVIAGEITQVAFPMEDSHGLLYGVMDALAKQGCPTATALQQLLNDAPDDNDEDEETKDEEEYEEIECLNGEWEDYGPDA